MPAVVLTEDDLCRAVCMLLRERGLDAIARDESGACTIAFYHRPKRSDERRASDTSPITYEARVEPFGRPSAP
jgi:hypothetical protein